MIMHSPKIDLYPHNQETYDRIIEMWKTSNRVAVIQATGTGKTYLMLRCMVDFEPSKKVVLAPSNYILDQLLSKANGNLPNTELLTYAKLAFMTKEEISDLNPSLIVLDEFHRCGADKWELGVDTLIKMFPNAKILGTSATPIRYLDNARDMSDELFDGNIAVNLSLSDAIVRGILPMPKYISALYTFDEEINNLQAKIEKSKNDEETKKEYLKEVETLKNKLNKSKGIPEILRKHISDVGGKFIVFCKDKQHLNEMESTVVEWFQKAKIGKEVEKYRVVSSEIENNKEMLAFRENRNSDNVRLLFSIDMLNEGIHIDDVTGVILLRPTISPIIYFQQIGRSIQVGNINNPIIFDFVNNFNNIHIDSFIAELKESREKEIKKNTVINSKEMIIPDFTVLDETKGIFDLFVIINEKIIPDWDVMFHQLIDYKEKNNTFKIGGNNIKLNVWVKNQRNRFKQGSLSDERVGKLNSIDFPWSLYDDIWNIMYSKYKHSIDSDSAREDIQLKRWIIQQRLLYSKNKIDKKRIEKLNKLNFIWSVFDESWMDSFDILLKYKNVYGNCNAKNGLVFQDFPLGNWVSKQREHYRNQKIDKNRIEMLNGIGFVWSLGKRRKKEDKPNE